MNKFTNSATRRIRWVASGVATATLIAPRLFALETLLQEDFNTDGTKANPARYSVSGGGAYEPPFVDGGNDQGIPASQLGPVYWARNSEVSFVGVPAATPARRVIMPWDGGITADETSAEMGKLFDNALKWLLNGKAKAKVVFTPNQSAAQALADRVTALGHTVVDDDSLVAATAAVGDAVIRAPGVSDPSRFGKVAIPMLVFSSPDYDDLLVSSIGTATSFESGPGAITDPTHPISLGVPTNFSVATGTHNYNLLGDSLSDSSITVATFTRSVPPTVSSLADVDKMVANTKQNVKATGTATTLDFSLVSVGDWDGGNELPAPDGGSPGILGMVARGKLNVTAAGKYSFALGNDDGARLRIDVAKDGLSAADNVINDDAAHAHQVKYADVTFASAGTYDFEVAYFNSGGNGDVELSVSTKAGGGDTSAVKPGDGSASTWELVGAEANAKVKLSGSIAVTSYAAAGDPVLTTMPLINVINGPADAPPGSFFGGGPFVGFEGSGFFAGSALNKFNSADFTAAGGYRSVRLKPVNVSGKPKVKVTIAVAATFLDFETNDYLSIMAYPDGESSTPVELGHFTAPGDAFKYFVDTAHNNANRLTLRFQDVTYDVPAGANNLIIEVRAATTFWNETVAFDNIRVTSGDTAPPASIALSVARDPAGIKASWTGGTSPFLVQYKTALGDSWADLVTTTDSSVTLPTLGGGGFVRVVGSTTKSVQLLKAKLDSLQEGSPASAASGIGWVSVSDLNLTYFVSYDSLSSGVVAAHIHDGARGASGAPFILFTPVVGSKFGTISGTFALNAAQKARVLGGNTYFNIHTANFGGGEVRGQIEP